jgi:hypothetical protein
MVCAQKKVKMYHLLFQISTRTCFRREIALKERQGGFLVHSRFLPSLACNIFSGNIPRPNFHERPSKTTFPASGAESWLRHTQQRAAWPEKWTKIGVCFAEKFHRNVAISRNFYTSSHVHSGNSEKIGEWVG